MDTVSLHFDEFGASDKDALIILHGFFASSRNWRLIAQRLANDYHVFVPDMRNHGLSPHHPQLDYPSMAEDLLRFLDERGLDQAHLIGHSMGGKIAMWFALKYPQRLNKLIIADIAPVNYQHNFNKTVFALKALPLKELTNRKQAENLLAPFIPDLSYRQFLLQNLNLQDGQYRWRVDLDIFQQMTPNIAAFPDTDHLAVFKRAALFIAGADSNLVQRDLVTPLFPNADVKFIPNAGHWLHVQQPNVFLALVSDFLSL